MIYCILPAYNEEKGISSQLNSLKDLFEENKLEYKLLVVNDGSTDRTAAETERFKRTINVDLVNHPTNLGPGRAFKSGFNHILPGLKDDDIVITMDCDNTLQLKVLKSMIDKIRQGHDVVLGSVYVKGGQLIGVPLLRKALSYNASLLYRIFFPIKGVRDYTAFYRAMKGSALKYAYDRYGDRLIESKGFGCMAEMLIRLRALPLSIAEVPMTVRYDLKTSRSKLKVMRTVKEHFGIIRRNLFKPASS